MFRLSYKNSNDNVVRVPLYFTDRHMAFVKLITFATPVYLDKTQEYTLDEFAHDEDRSDGILKYKTTHHLTCTSIVLESGTNIMSTSELENCTTPKLCVDFCK